MATIITKKELYHLRQDLRNKTKLHEAARARVTHLEAIIKTQKQEIAELKAAREQDHALILELKRQLEELRAKIFGKRKKYGADMGEEDEEAQNDTTDENNSGQKKHSTRPIPPTHRVTHTKEHRFDDHRCSTCSTELTSLQTVDYYREDIVLPHEQQLTTVTRTSIERGWCVKCRRFQHAQSPPSAQVMLGRNVKAYIAYLAILLRLSYEQIRTHLKISYALNISDGEIGHILEKEAMRKRPAYEALNKRIDRQPGIHEDETPWRVQHNARGNYGWVKTGTETGEVIFRFGESRGGGVARAFTGAYTGIGITDDYALYHGIFGEKHQLCWSKPHRKLRDLARSKVFTGGIHEHCKDTYRRFSSIYTALRETLAREWDSERNKHVRATLMEQLRSFAEPDARDPKAMARVKTRLREVTDKYFTCLLYEGIPDTNNKAERALRHMVIKRKTSFGSKTQKGAETLSVLASVILSLYWTKPETFWSEYMAGCG